MWGGRMEYANQRQVIINRDVVVKGGNGRAFVVAYNDNLIDAMQSLSHTAFKVYLCLLLNRDKYTLDFSPEYISKTASVHPETVRRAFRELIEKGFIIQLDDKHYLFYEIPKKILNLKPQEEKRQFTDTDTGEIYYLTYKELVSYMGKDAVSMWQEAKVYEPTT